MSNRDLIEEVRDRVNIVDLISEYTELKRSGLNEYKSCCPIHNDKSPSMFINEGKQVFNCFGCGAGGDVIEFVQAVENMDFIQAVEFLGAMSGMDMSKFDSKGDYSHLRNLYTVNESVAKLYQIWLRRPDYKAALVYAQERGLTNELMATFGIGYAAPPSKDTKQAALAYYPKMKPESKEVCKELNLIRPDLKNKETLTDFYTDRLMFPVRDVRGRTIAFSGRLIPRDWRKMKIAKYKNSMNIQGFFNKSLVLYGLYESITRNKEKNKGTLLDHIVVSEGAMDIVRQYDIGLNAVGTLGTAVTLQQARLAFRYTNKIILCMDGDEAGIESAVKACKIFSNEMRQGRVVRVYLNDPGHDPDEMIAIKGPKQYREEVLEDSMSITDFLVERLVKGIDVKDTSSAIELSNRAEGLLADMQDQNLINIITSFACRKINLPESTIQVFSKANEGQDSLRRKRIIKQAETEEDLKRMDLLVMRAIALVHAHPHLLNKIDNLSQLETSEKKGINVLLDILDIYMDSPFQLPEIVINRWYGNEMHGTLKKTTHQASEYRSYDPVMAATMLNTTLTGLCNVGQNEKHKRYEYLKTLFMENRITLKEQSEMSVLMSSRSQWLVESEAKAFIDIALIEAEKQPQPNINSKKAGSRHDQTEHAR